MANRMTPPAEGQEKDVLLVLDKQQGKVSAVKGIDKEGNFIFLFFHKFYFLDTRRILTA